MAFIAHPAYAFMVYQLIYFFNPATRWWAYMLPSLPYSLMSVLLMFVVFAKDFKQHHNNKLFAPPQMKWFYLVTLCYTLTIFYAPNAVATKEGVINFIKMLVILSVAYKLIDTLPKLNAVLTTYIVGASYVGFLAYQTGRNAAGRVEGIGTVDSPDSNGIAAAIVPTLVLSLYYFWFSKSWKLRALICVSGAFVANAIVLINSRGAFLAAIVSAAYFMFFMYFSKMQKRGQKWSATALIILGLVAAVNVIDESALDRFRSIKEEEQTTEQQTSKTRVYFWIAAVEVAFDYPFGQGIHGFDHHAPNYLPQHMDTGFSRNRSVHSTWFEALTEVGFHGFFFFLMMLYACFASTRAVKKALLEDEDHQGFFRIVAIEAAFVAFMVAMTFMNRFRAEILYWCVLFTACAYNIHILQPKRIAEEEQKAALKAERAAESAMA